MIRLGYPTQNLIPASTNQTSRLLTCKTPERCANTLHHQNPGGLTSKEAFDLSLPTWRKRKVPPKLHLSGQNPEKQAGAHAYCVDLADWQSLVNALDGREADVMVEAKGKEHALVPMGIKW